MSCGKSIDGGVKDIPACPRSSSEPGEVKPQAGSRNQFFDNTDSGGRDLERELVLLLFGFTAQSVCIVG
jgi:hypothetical protein